MAKGLIISFIILCLFYSQPSHADCDDPPAPRVVWKKCILDDKKFQKSDLSAAVLVSASLARTNFSRSDMTNVDARWADFFNADLRGTIFTNAKLLEADFTKADLTNAEFSGADLRETRFFGAILRGADFTGANIREADFFRADLTGAHWLDGLKVCATGSFGRCK